MIVKYNKVREYRQFKDIKVGTTFLYEDMLYLKVEDASCQKVYTVYLSTNCIVSMGLYTDVLPVNSEITILDYTH